MEEHEKECLYSHTDVGPYRRYPSYLNISRSGNGDVEITVRTRDALSAGTIRLSAPQWVALKLILTEPLDQN